jgi:hypothetical protein
MRPHDAANERARTRLRTLVARLDVEDLARTLAGGWTVASTLAHLAFWDRIAEARWRHRRDQGTALFYFTDDMVDVLNAAGLYAWRQLPGPVAAHACVSAAEETDALIATLSDDLIAEAHAHGFGHFLERAGHRDSHADAIERALR